MMNVEQILAELSQPRKTQPLEALAAADEHREALVPELIASLQEVVGDPYAAVEKEHLLSSYALYLLAKWREPRAFAAMVKFFSLPDELPFDIAGDIPTQHGAVMLASVCGGQIGPLQALVENVAANEYCRGEGLYALAVLTAWGELPRETLVGYLRELFAGKLERPGSETVWAELVSMICDLELWELAPEAEAAFQAGVVDEGFISREFFQEERSRLPGKLLARFKEHHKPITDVASEISWWGVWSEEEWEEEDLLDEEDEEEFPAYPPVWGEPLPGEGAGTPVPQPYIAPPKIGRNDPCPCGSGKKYKKCCGQ